MEITRRAMLWMSAVAAVPGRTFASGPEAPRYPAAHSAAERVRQILPNVELRTHENKRVRFYDDLVRGRTVLINLMYVNCQGSCPTTLANLVKVQKLLGDRMGKDILMLSLSVDPAHDTPAVLADHAEMIGAGKGWIFATGRSPDIDAIRKALGMYDVVDEADNTSHFNLVTIGSEPLGQWCAIPALSNPTDIAQTVHRVMRTT
jgi:protein SCO1